MASTGDRTLTTTLSDRNRRLEVKATQITGQKEGEAGVYARLLKDGDGNFNVDVRYFAYNPKAERHKETIRGVIFDPKQLFLLRKALKEFADEIRNATGTG